GGGVGGGGGAFFFPSPRSGLTATQVLIGAIVAGFVLEALMGGGSTLGSPTGFALIQLGALQPFLIADGQWWRLFSSMFLHAGFLHIAFNGYALWLFGTAVESLFGWRRFLALYLVTGFLAGVASYAFGPANSVGVGASGAIFGLFGAFIAYNLRRRNSVQGMAALRWAGTLLLLNALIALGFRSIDWRAHLGGLVAGLLAGYAAEGFGPRAARRLEPWIGMGILVVAGIAIFAWRTEQLRALPLFDQAVRFFS
ncbi:MAG: rhomboid family intramembrane serine protease, partial [Actinomycetota bacterium]